MMHRRRRAHSKSRSGCKQCKARRVKCDELKPICGNCSRRGESCDSLYTMSAMLPTRTSFQAPNLARDLSSSLQPSHAAVFARAKSLGDHLGLSLLSHFIEMNSAMQPGAAKVFSACAVDLAQGSHILMNAILGLSAFHLRHIGLSKLSLQTASHEYMARAIHSFTHGLRKGIDAGNAAVMIVACALVSVHASVNRPFLDDIGSKFQPPMHWFHTFRSASNFFFAVLPHLRNSFIRHLVEEPSLPQQSSQTTCVPAFYFLLDALDLDSIGHTDAISAYHFAITKLDQIYNHPSNSHILRFPAMVPLRFVTLLESGNPLALVIVGYYFMLLKMHCPLWWIRGAPEREFGTIMRMLPRDWWYLMSWAIDEIGWKADTEHMSDFV